jgi:prepilin-type N-terminal cleavage/methylation domain-containing protein
MKRVRGTGEGGFTLIELLGVTVILGIISAVAIVSIGGFLNSSNASSCSADAKAVSTAEDTAFAANGSYLSEQDLVAGGFMKDPSSSYDIVLNGSAQYQLVPTGDCAAEDAVGVPGIQAGVLNSFVVSAPASASAGGGFSVTVTAKDGLGNTLSTFSGTVQFSTTDGGSVTLPAGYTFTASDGGTHKFTGVKLVTAGTQTISVSSSGKSGSASVTVNAGTATKLAFVQQPTATTKGTVINPAVTVQVEDQYGNLVTTSSASVTVAFGSNPSGATLGGTKTQTASSGVASFGDLTVSKIGTGYTLTATSNGLTSATSSAFNINSAPATKVVFTTQPSAGASINAGTATAFAVSVEDATGAVVTSDNTTTITLTPSPATGSFSCNNAGGAGPVTVSSGVASFSCSIGTPGSGYKLSTSNSAGLTNATSNSFNIVVGPASKFTVTAPSSATAGTQITGIKLTATDAAGNTVTTYTGSKTIAWSGASTSPSGQAPAYPATTVTFANGVSTTSLNATFYTAESVTLTAANGGSPTGSTTITVIANASATKLRFTSSSASCSSGTVSVGNGGSWTSKVSTTDTWGNPTPRVSATAVALANNQGNALLAPLSLTIVGSTTESSGAFTQSRSSGNTTYTVTASGGGLTSVSCGVKK